MSNALISKQKYDLGERTLKFAKDCINVCKTIKREMINAELVPQLVRSASSVGANYREANEAGSKKEFYHRINICRKESKESRYWIELLLHNNEKAPVDLARVSEEALQLTKIFSSIAKNSNRL